MLAVRIIPCLDVKDSRVVKGIHFKNLRDAGDPVELAEYYDKEGADELVFLDISASREKRKTMLDMVKKVASRIFIPFTIGGGISSVQDIHDLLDVGADKVSINTAAINNPGLISEAARLFGSQCIVVAVDARRDENGWTVTSYGGSMDEQRDALRWIKEVEDRGAGEILLTSMDTDGSKNGFDIEITSTVSDMISIPVIASGGGGNMQHFYDAVKYGRADAVLAASVFHYRQLTIRQVKQFLNDNGIPVRLI